MNFMSSFHSHIAEIHLLTLHQWCTMDHVGHVGSSDDPQLFTVAPRLSQTQPGAGTGAQESNHAYFQPLIPVHDLVGSQLGGAAIAQTLSPDAWCYNRTVAEEDRTPNPIGKVHRRPFKVRLNCSHWPSPSR